MAGGFFVLGVGIVLCLAIVALDRLIYYLTLWCRRMRAPALVFSKKYIGTIVSITDAGVYVHIEFQPRDFFLPNGAIDRHRTVPRRADNSKVGMSVGYQLALQYFGKDFLGRARFKVLGSRKPAIENKNRETNDEDSMEGSDAEVNE